MESQVNDLRSLLDNSKIGYLILKLFLNLLDKFDAPDFLVFQVNVTNENLIEIIIIRSGFFKNMAFNMTIFDFLISKASICS